MNDSASKVKLIVEADEPALFFSSIATAEKYLEAIDVANGVYKAAFGPKGEPFQIKSDGNRVLISVCIGELPQTTELRAVLARFFAAIGKSISHDESLESLIRKCEVHISA